jgi:hypothetical protein
MSTAIVLANLLVTCIELAFSTNKKPETETGYILKTQKIGQVA